METWLPKIMIVQYLICGIGYAAVGKWGNAIYWFAAAVLTIGLLMIPKYG